MKSIFLSLIIVVFVLSCVTNQSAKRFYEFYPDNSSIEDGDSVNLVWKADNSEYVIIRSNKGDTLLYKQLKINSDKKPNLQSGVIIVKPESTSTYKMEVKIDNQPIEVECKVNVSEDISKTPSNYIKGRINFITYLNNYNKNTSNNSRLSIYNIVHIPNTDRYKLYVQVLDAYGNQISNLAPPFGSLDEINFWDKVIVNNACRTTEYKIPITDKNIFEINYKSNHNIDMAFALDYSASLAFQKHDEKLKDAYYKSLKYFGKMDNVAVSIINHNNYIDSSFAKRGNIEKDLPSFELFAGGNNFFSGLSKTASVLDNARNDKALIIFTHYRDQNNYSKNKIDEEIIETIKKVRKNDGRVYLVGYTRDGFADPYMVEKFEKHGARVYDINNFDDLDDIFQDIVLSMKRTFVIDCKLPPIFRDQIIDFKVLPKDKSMKVVREFYPIGK